MAITNREELKQYCLRALGSPVLEINVDDEQLEDRITDAIEHFRLYHYEGIEKLYLKHMVTQDDITNKWIPISPMVYGITRVLPIVTGSGSSKSLFDLQYQLRLNDLYDLSSTSIIYYNTVMSHLSLLDLILNGHIVYRFNRMQDRLYLDLDWTADVEIGHYVIVECYRALDPTEFIKIWSEPWLKHYITAQFKKQWGVNLKKFSGMQLPGGVTIDGDALYTEAMNEIKELEDDLMNKSSPLEFFLG